MNPKILNELSIYYDGQLLAAFEELASLYNVRSSLARQYLVGVDKVRAFDFRINKLSEYLLCRPEITKQITFEFLEEAENIAMWSDAEMFASALIAFLSNDIKWIERIVNGYIAVDTKALGIVNALAWLPSNLLQVWLHRFWMSNDLNHKYIAAHVSVLQGNYTNGNLSCFMHRVDCQEHNLLFEQLLFLSGIHKEGAFWPIIRDACENNAMAIKSSAYLARWLNNDKSAFNDILEFSLQENTAFEVLSPWIIISLSQSASQNYLSLALKSDCIADELLIKAIGFHGDPSVLPWLINKMRAPHYQPWLGLAFYQISGIELKSAGLTDSPEEVDALESNTYLPMDMSLPFPDREKLLELAESSVAGLKSGVRYFMGVEVETAGTDSSALHWQHKNPIGLTRQVVSIHKGLTGESFSPYYYVTPNSGNQAAAGERAK